MREQNRLAFELRELAHLDVAEIASNHRSEGPEALEYEEDEQNEEEEEESGAWGPSRTHTEEEKRARGEQVDPEEEYGTCEYADSPGRGLRRWAREGSSFDSGEEERSVDVITEVNEHEEEEDKEEEQRRGSEYLAALRRDLTLDYYLKENETIFTEEESRAQDESSLRERVILGSEEARDLPRFEVYL